MRRFPIMGAKTLRSIPWDMIAPHEKQAFDNHEQSLERLAQRGGLDPIEVMGAIEGIDPFRACSGMKHKDLKKRGLEDEQRLIQLVKDWESIHQ